MAKRKDGYVIYSEKINGYYRHALETEGDIIPVFVGNIVNATIFGFLRARLIMWLLKLGAPDGEFELKKIASISDVKLDINPISVFRKMLKRKQ